MDRLERIAEVVVMASNKDRNVSDVVAEARNIRHALQQAYKDFLKVGRKVKYLEPVGSLVAEAINSLVEAEMSMKAVVDAGNEWEQARTARKGE